MEFVPEDYVELGSYTSQQQVVNSDEVGNGDGEDNKILDFIYFQAPQYACSVLFSPRGLKHASFSDVYLYILFFHSLAVEPNGEINQYVC
jgi:hypothetical protein